MDRLYRARFKQYPADKYLQQGPDDQAEIDGLVNLLRKNPEPDGVKKFVTTLEIITACVCRGPHWDVIYTYGEEEVYILTIQRNRD